MLQPACGQFTLNWKKKLSTLPCPHVVTNLKVLHIKNHSLSHKFFEESHFHELQRVLLLAIRRWDTPRRDKQKPYFQMYFSDTFEPSATELPLR
jgi:hypothetical protein